MDECSVVLIVLFTDLKKHATLEKPLATLIFANPKEKNWCWLINWFAGDQVAGGTVNIEVSPTGLFSVIKKDFTYQLCNVLPTGCPVKKGKTTITATKTLPSSIPSVGASWQSYCYLDWPLMCISYNYLIVKYMFSCCTKYSREQQMASKYRGAACWIQIKSVSYINPLQLMINKSHTRRSFYQSKSSAVLQPIDSIAGSTWLVLPIHLKTIYSCQNEVSLL